MFDERELTVFETSTYKYQVGFFERGHSQRSLDNGTSKNNVRHGCKSRPIGKLLRRVLETIFVVDCIVRNTLMTVNVARIEHFMPIPHHPPAAVRKVLAKLGSDIRDARRRRGLPMAVVAERAFTSRSTLQRIENGDPSVSMGIYAAVLHSLGLLDGIGQLADISTDTVGQALSTEALPKRVRLRSVPKKSDSH